MPIHPMSLLAIRADMLSTPDAIQQHLLCH